MIVLVTGASSGIGMATCNLFAQNGYDVIINYYSNYESANRLKQEIETNYHIKAYCVQADISNEESVISMFENISKYYNKIDVLVNNAGICKDELIIDKTVETFQKVINTNLTGTFLVSKHVKKIMDRGSIINVSSDASTCEYSEYSVDYDASKAGINILTKDFAKNYAPNIRVNAVLPGWVKTPMNNGLDNEEINSIEKNCLLGRMADPIEIANIIYFLASSNASYINGSLIVANGGK